MNPRFLLASTAAGLTVALAAHTLSACPTCPTNLGPSLSEQVATADIAVIATWKDGREADLEEGFAGSSTYEVSEVLRDKTGTVEQGAEVTLKRYRQAESGETFLMLALTDEPVDWQPPLAANDAVLKYLRNLPPADAPIDDRLQYALAHLEHPELTIANDAMAEFAVAPYEDVAKLKEHIEPDKLRSWLTNPETDQTRIGFYSLLLGLVGNAGDAEFLRSRILEPTQDFRLGVDGMVAGFLLLTGAEGLDVIDREKLAPADAPVSEVFATMQGLQFMWTYEPGRIEAERLRASMRVLLDRPDMADLIITTLGRWEDWSVIDRLMELYDEDEYAVPSIQRAIVRYFLVAERAKPSEEGGPKPESAKKAAEYLAQLRETDPETVKQAERFFFLQ
ncbi:MAG: hypothetical protein DWQ34_16140 [Planctomycetota bacterium]|nr:MAG: hypothetical protein DWQ34_16140 [Planctomycetota bacterium]REK30987.1 MAG: hypothetical protein DWQ41_00760 [Planctomycetota bacterium]REK36897.1 MAG: hypothetical protein DWQ45_09850 [Planctomycetota bacterium]